MRKLIAVSLLLFALLLFADVAQAQTTTPDTIVVNKADLPANLLVQLEQKKKMAEVTENLEIVSGWAGTGREIGIAVNESLKAVTEQTAEFAKTDVGKLTMFLVAWKVLATDAHGLISGVLGIIIGIPLLIFANAVCYHVYRRTFIGYRFVQESQGWLWWRKRNYSFREHLTKDWSDDVPAIFWVVLVLIWAIANIWIITGVIF